MYLQKSVEVWWKREANSSQRLKAELILKGLINDCDIEKKNDKEIEIRKSESFNNWIRQFNDLDLTCSRTMLASLDY